MDLAASPPWLLILARTQDCLTVLRKNKQFASRSVFHSGALHFVDHEDPIITKLKSLRTRLQSLLGRHSKRSLTSDPEASQPAVLRVEVNAVELVVPFVEILRSSQCGGALKAPALSGLVDIIKAGLILTPATTRESASAATNSIIDALANCKFELEDLQNDEAVLFLTLRCLVVLIQSSCGPLITDEGMWAGLAKMISLASEDGGKRRSKVLQEMAACSLADTVRVIFTGFERLLRPSTPKTGATTKMRGGDATSADVVPGYRGYGLPVALKLFHYFVGMIKSGKNSAHSRVLGLRMVNHVLESAQRKICSCDAATDVIKDELCCYLLQSLQTAANADILAATLRTFHTLLEYCRGCLKMQIESFFRIVYLPVLRSSSQKISAGETFGTAEQKELVLESLCDISASWPNFWAELYGNYDCDPLSSNLLQEMCSLLSRHAFPVFIHAEKLHCLGRPQLLSLRCLTAGLEFMSERCNADVAGEQTATMNETGTLSLPSAEALRAARIHKEKLQRAGMEFNKKPKRGLALLRDLGLLTAPEHSSEYAAEVAQFLRYAPHLDKATVGEYLGGGESDFDQSLREHYVETFNMAGQSMLNALRMFLEAFKLPGEAQQIDRLLQAFSGAVYKQSPDARLMNSVDVAYLLSFSIIMLNTDLHNENIRPERKMTLSQFVTQNKNYGTEVSGGRELPIDFLVQIYNSIKSREIRKNGGEQQGDAVTISPDMWRDKIRSAAFEKKSSVLHGTGYVFSNSLLVSANSVEYDLDVFKAAWASANAALAVALDTVEEGSAMQEAIHGYLLAAKCAAFFADSDTLDNIVSTLSRFSGLLHLGEVTSPKTFSSTPFEVGSIPRETRMTRATALLKFGDDHKAQMATMALFGIARQFGAIMRHGWKSILLVSLNLQRISLAPNDLLRGCHGMIDCNGPESKAFQEAVATSMALTASAEDGHSPSAMSGIFSWFFGGNDDAEDANRSADEEEDDEGEGGGGGGGGGRGKTEEKEKEARNSRKQICLEQLATGGIRSVFGPSGRAAAIAIVRGETATDETMDFYQGRVDLCTRAALRCARSCQTFELFLEAGSLPLQSLEALLSSCVTACSPDGEKRGPEFSGISFDDDEAILFFLRITSTVLEGCKSEPSKVAAMWPDVSKTCASIVSNAKIPAWSIEAAALCLVNICIASGSSQDLVDRSLGSLSVFVPSEVHVASAQTTFRATAHVADALAGHFAQAIFLFVKTLSTKLSSESAWETLLSLLSVLSSNERSAEKGFHALQHLVNDEQLQAGLPLSVVSVIVDYALGDWSGRSYDAADVVALLKVLYRRVQPILAKANAMKESKGEASTADNDVDLFNECFRPLIEAGCQCIEGGNGGVRKHSFQALLTMIKNTSSSLLKANDWDTLYLNLLFPLAKGDKFSTENLKSLSSFLCEAFLAHMDALRSLATFPKIWAHFIRAIEAVAEKNNQEEGGKEAITSDLHICIEKMKSIGIFDDSIGVELWELTTVSLQGCNLLTMMKAVIAKAGRLVVTQRPIPVPSPSEVLVKIHATALNRADTLQRAGKYPVPKGETDILGLEMAGTVVEAGGDVPASFGAGARVMALLGGGGYAEFVAVNHELLMPVHDSIPLDVAAGIPETWLTAFQLLHLVGKVQPGESVVVHAAGSGVGTAAIQLASAAGARVTATAGTAEKLGVARALGAKECYNYKEEDWASLIKESGMVDLILDPVGGSYSEENLRCCAIDSRWVLYGLLGGAEPNASSLLAKLLRKRVSLLSTTLRSRSFAYKAGLVSQFSASSLSKFVSKDFEVILDSKSFLLDDVQAAHDYMETNANIGKIIVRVE
eukprot:g426.t1